MRVHALGTPASYVAGGGHYYTNVGDVVVRAINSVSPLKALEPNVSIQSDDGSGHALIETYLMTNGAYTYRTLSDILQHHAEMEQIGPSGVCIPWSKDSSTAPGSSYGQSHRPYHIQGSYTGPITITVDAYDAPNRFTVTDQRGYTLLSTSSNFSGKKSISIDYDSSVHGTISMFVSNPGSNNAWAISISCD